MTHQKDEPCVVWWCPRERLQDSLYCESNHDAMVLHCVQYDREN